MMEHLPPERHPALQILSRDHHHGLLFCWKIRKGFSNHIPPDRMKKYADWFWETYLQAHFMAEEKYIFSILQAEDILVKRALAEHRRLKRLFEDDIHITRSLNSIEEELEKHIRFEERVIFNEVQKTATNKQLRLIEKHHHTPVAGGWDDKFWK